MYVHNFGSSQDALRLMQFNQILETVLQLAKIILMHPKCAIILMLSNYLIFSILLPMKLLLLSYFLVYSLCRYYSSNYCNRNSCFSFLLLKALSNAIVSNSEKAKEQFESTKFNLNLGSTNIIVVNCIIQSLLFD